MAEVCQAIVDKTLDKVEFEDKTIVCKYIVPDGYPDTEYAGEIIDVDEKAIEEMGAKVFYVAVSQENDENPVILFKGIVASCESNETVNKIAEKACKFVKDNVYHRRYVGTKDLKNKSVEHMKEILN